MDPDGVEAYLGRLIPHCLVVTPNLREAAALTKCDVADLDSVPAMTEAAQQIRDFGATFVVVKGGHLRSVAHDVVVGPDGVTVLRADRIPTQNDHGTGCSLSSALTARLALGTDVITAITQAKEFVALGLSSGAGWKLGAGHGPIDHFGWSAAP